MRWLLIALGALGGFGGLIYLIGSMLPREHSAEVGRTIRAEAKHVFARIRDFEGRPKWRASVKRVSLENERFFIEEGGDGPIRFEVMEAAAPQRLVTRIADDNLEFGGKWTITIEPAGGGSKVTVREDGFVKSPVFRFFARFVFGHTKTITAFLDDLDRSFA